MKGGFRQGCFSMKKNGCIERNKTAVAEAKVEQGGTLS